MTNTNSAHHETWRCSVVTEYEWQRPYIAAVLETNPASLIPLVSKAENAIHMRLEEIEETGEATPKERFALEDACSCLLVLRKGSA